MKYAERNELMTIARQVSESRKEIMGALNPDQLAGDKKGAGAAEGYFRWHVLQLLASMLDSQDCMLQLVRSIADSQDSTAYAYQEMLRMQQAKAGRPPQQQTRPQQSPRPASSNGGEKR